MRGALAQILITCRILTDIGDIDDILELGDARSAAAGAIVETEHETTILLETDFGIWHDTIESVVRLEAIWVSLVAVEYGLLIVDTDGGIKFTTIEYVETDAGLMLPIVALLDIAEELAEAIVGELRVVGDDGETVGVDLLVAGAVAEGGTVVDLQGRMVAERLGVHYAPGELTATTVILSPLTGH